MSAIENPPPTPKRGFARHILGALAWLFLIAAAAALAADVVAATRSGAFALSPLGKVWFSLHSTSLLLLQPAVERYLAPALWRWIIQPILEAPAVLVLAVPAPLLFLLARPRRRELSDR